MRKRVLALMLALSFVVSGFVVSNVNVEAEEPVGYSEDVDISYVMTEDALVGYAELKTRGAYLAEGYSSINDAGAGRIGCGGVTNAAVRCNVSVAVMVERKVNGVWNYVTSWSKTNTNAYTASISKYLYVTSGYYYRVRSVHDAGTDSSSSWTSGLWM